MISCLSNELGKTFFFPVSLDLEPSQTSSCLFSQTTYMIFTAQHWGNTYHSNFTVYTAKVFDKALKTDIASCVNSYLFFLPKRKLMKYK